MLIRGVETAGSFKTIQLHDIEKYRTDNFHIQDRIYLCANQNITIIAKHDKIFNLKYLDNREELIDMLKSFTNSFEET